MCVCVCVCVWGFQSEEGASLFRPFPPFHRTFPTQGSDGERDVAAPLIRTPLSPPRWPLRLKTLQRGGHRRSVLHLHHRSVSDCTEFCAFIFFWIENVSLQSALMPEYQHLTEIIKKKKLKKKNDHGRHAMNGWKNVQFDPPIEKQVTWGFSFSCWLIGLHTCLRAGHKGSCL